VDREATEAAFSKISLGSPETCECDYCRNLVAARDKAYPEEARRLFAQLGIDYRKETETWEWNRVSPKLHSYGGFFHFVGSIKSGAEAVQYVNGTGTFHLERIGENFEYGFSRVAALIEEPFKNQAVTQFEFTTLVPWVIEVPEPE
jgi:hypothetical protein